MSGIGSTATSKPQGKPSGMERKMEKTATIQVDSYFPINAETNEFCKQVIEWMNFLNHNFAGGIRLSVKFLLLQPQGFVTASIFVNGESILYLILTKEGVVTEPSRGQFVDDVPMSGMIWRQIFKPALLRAFQAKKDKLEQLIKHTEELSMGFME